MKYTLDEDKPIYLQIKGQLEESIMNGSIHSSERVPSTNEFAKFYKINPATAAKGINELVQEGILFKKRGVGMFVTDEAEEILIGKRKKVFYENFIKPLKKEAENLRLTNDELIGMIEGEGTADAH